MTAATVEAWAGVALRATDGAVGRPKGAAARLRMKRSTLYKKMTKLGIFSRPE